MSVCYLMKVFVSYKRDHAESEAVLSLLEAALSGASTKVYSDRLLTAGEWRPKLLEWIDGCNLFVVLLSERSIESEEVKDEVHRAYDRWVRTGRKKPTIIPVNVRFSGSLGGFRRDLSGFQALRWAGEADNETLLKKIREELARGWKPWVYGLALAALLLVAFLAYPFLLPLRNTLKAREASPGPLPGSASTLSARRITDVGNVIAVAVSPDAKTVFVNRNAFDQSAGVHVTDVNGAPPRKLFDTFGGKLACGTSNCYFSGAVDHLTGVYRFSASKAPVMLFSGDFHNIDISPDGDRLVLTRSGESPITDLVVRRIADGSQTVEWSSRDALHDPSWHPDGRSLLYVGAFNAVIHEKHFGKPIPDDLRWLYGQPDLVARSGVELRGGVTPDEWYFIDSFVPATVEAATSTWFDVGKDRFPFAIDDAGNYFAVKAGDRNDSEVLYIDHDGNSEWPVAASLRKFMLQEDDRIAP